MKTINDFKIINGVAVLDGVAYAEEAKVIDEFLKTNTQIRDVTVKTKDGRYFELKNGKLVLSNGQTFTNPYFVKELSTLNEMKEDKKINNNRSIEPESIMNIHEIEHQLIVQDKRIDGLKSLIKEIANLLNNYLK